MKRSLPSPSPRFWRILCASFAFLLPLLLFLPAVHFDFVDLDDHAYVVHNNLATAPLTLSNLKNAFVSRGPANLHVPAVWVSFMLDVALYGNHPWAFHLSNILLHSAASLLLFFLLLRLARDFSPSASPRPGPSAEIRHSEPSAFFPLLLALLWSLHSLRVESVAWVTERKDCLSVFFGLLVLHAWLSALGARRPVPRLLHGVAAFLFFAAGLLSKPSLVPLPLFLALLALLPDRPKPRLVPLALALLPFLALSAVSSRATTAIHDVFNNVEPAPLLSRLATVPSVVFFYAAKILFPRHLSVIYPQWTSPLWLGGLLAVPLLLAAFWIVRQRRSLPLLWLGSTFALLFFLPASGIVPIPYNLVADRYVCLPAIGLSIALLSLQPFLRPSPTLAVFALLVALYAVATAVYLPTWQNSSSVYLPARRLLPDHHSIRIHDALTAQRHGDFQAAHQCVERGLRFFSDETLLLLDAPNVAALAGPDAALRFLLDNRPRRVLLPLWAFHAASLQLMLSRCDDALATVEQTLPLAQPADPLRTLLFQIAMIAAWRAHLPDLALRYARLADRLPPGASSVEPVNFFPYYLALWDNAYQTEALRFFREMTGPDASPLVLNNIAWILSTSLCSPAPPSEAVDLAQRALAAVPPSHPSRPSLLDTLAAAQANAGHFEEAASTLAAALSALPPDAPSREPMQCRLSLYRRALPFREWEDRPVPVEEYTYDPHL